MLTCHLMTEAEKEQICAWKYADEYAVYDLPPYRLQAAKGVGLADPAKQKNFRSYYAGDVLVGFTNIRAEGQAAAIGIGVHPAYCGQGYGRQMLRMAVQTAREMHPGKEICLEVRTWNQRAIRCYQNVGFAIQGPAFMQRTGAGEGEFYRMIYQERGTP